MNVYYFYGIQHLCDILLSNRNVYVYIYAYKNIYITHIIYMIYITSNKKYKNYCNDMFRSSNYCIFKILQYRKR